MVHTFAPKLPRLLSRPEKCHEFPCTRHRYYTDDLPPAPDCFKEDVWCVFCHPSFFLIVLTPCSSAVYHSHRRLAIIRSRPIL